VLHTDQLTPVAAIIDRSQVDSAWPSDHYPVVTTFQPPGPTIWLEPLVIHRTAIHGGSLSDDLFTVTNIGTGTVTYSIAIDADWASVAPNAGASTGETDAVAVLYDVSELPIGEYAATITVTSHDALNSPQAITLYLTMEAVPPDLDGDGDVDQSDFGLLQACYSGPGVPVTDPACAAADLDKDNDVDQSDFSIFHACQTGAGVPADPNCAGP
jgi:hypothetical protein